MAQPVNKPTKYDYFIIISIIIFAVLIFLIFTFSKGNSPDGVVFKVDGKIHSAYSFSDLKNGEIIEIETQYGYNKFLYENKSIKCIESSCPDKTEIKTGAISEANQILVCLPNHLTAQITGNEKIDVVSY